MRLVHFELGLSSGELRGSHAQPLCWSLEGVESFECEAERGWVGRREGVFAGRVVVLRDPHFSQYETPKVMLSRFTV